MTDSPALSFPFGTPREDRAQSSVDRLKTGLLKSLKTGDLDRARAALRMAPPATARAAVMQLGAPYLQDVRQCTKARLDGRRGTAAADAFIREELRPLVLHAARRPLHVKPPKKSVLRTLVRNVAAVALAIGLSSPVMVNDGTTAPSPVLTETVATTTAQSDISALRADFARTALGRDMLAMADAHGVTIEYDETLTGGPSAGVYHAGARRTRIDPARPMPEQIMFLAHELRHAWQDITLDYGGMEARLLTPNQQWTLRRYLEADAFAFSAYFMAQRMAELPDEPLPGGNREMGSARLLHAEFSSDDGLTNEEYRQFAFERMLGFLEGYNERHLNLSLRSNNRLEEATGRAEGLLTRGDLMGALLELNNLHRQMAQTPAAEAFEDYLRRFGGMSLLPDAPTALQRPPAPPGAGAAAAAGEAAPARPEPVSRDDDVNARLTEAEEQYRAFRALAYELTASVYTPNLPTLRRDFRAAEMEVQTEAPTGVQAAPAFPPCSHDHDHHHPPRPGR